MNLTCFFSITKRANSQFPFEVKECFAHLESRKKNYGSAHRKSQKYAEVVCQILGIDRPAKKKRE
jgi:hypothetical protein